MVNSFAFVGKRGSNYSIQVSTLKLLILTMAALNHAEPLLVSSESKTLSQEATAQAWRPP